MTSLHAMQSDAVGPVQPPMQFTLQQVIPLHKPDGHVDGHAEIR